jgi:hypothetical protein
MVHAAIAVLASLAHLRDVAVAASLTFDAFVALEKAAGQQRTGAGQSRKRGERALRKASAKRNRVNPRPHIASQRTREFLREIERCSHIPEQ